MTDYEITHSDTRIFTVTTIVVVIIIIIIIIAAMMVRIMSKRSLM